MPYTEKIAGSDTLVVAATGYGNKLGLPADGFFKSADLISADRIVITDPSKMMTLSGLPPDFSTFNHLLQYLRNLINQSAYKRTIFTGTSGGAHTALLLGHLLKADYVVAFAPYPYLSKHEFERQKDIAIESMKRVIDRFRKLPDDVKAYFDLNHLLQDWNGHTEYWVHVSRYRRCDLKRCRSLEGIKNLTVVPHPFASHAIASELAKTGRLSACFSFPYSPPIWHHTPIWHALKSMYAIKRSLNQRR